MPYIRKQRPQKKKRWFLNATVGPKAPFGLGGTGISMGTQAMVKRAVKRELAKQDETKTYSDSVAGGTNLAHNTIYTIAPHRLLSQGLGTDQRIGNQVFLRFIRLQGIISNLATQPSVRYRFMCVKSLHDFNVINSWVGGSGFGSTQLFYPNASNLVNALINNKLSGIQVMSDQQIVVRAPIANAVKDQRFSIDCKVMKKVTYKGTGASSLQDWNYYYLIIPYVEGGVTGTTLVGKVDLQYLVSFTDS